jgi:hypothetical protein
VAPTFFVGAYVLCGFLGAFGKFFPFVHGA